MEDILPEEEQYYENNSTNKFRNADYKQRENENIVYEGILSEYECKLIQTK